MHLEVRRKTAEELGLGEAGASLRVWWCRGDTDAESGEGVRGPNTGAGRRGKYLDVGPRVAGRRRGWVGVGGD